MRNRNLFFVVFSALNLPAFLALNANNESEKEERPNLLYIFPDQYRLFALGIWSDPMYKDQISTVGDPVHTPNLDKLAKSGALFTNMCSTQPVSSPHRAMLMSGMFPEKNGIRRNCTINNTEELHHDIVCFTDVLAQEGYETAYVGKTHWHRTQALFDKDGNYKGTVEDPGGSYQNRFDTYIPEGKSRHGNKFWYQHLNYSNHFNPIAYSNRSELIDGKSDGESYMPGRFTSTVEADVIIKYLKNKNNERDASKPFSIIWSINPPHPPYSKLSDCDSTIYNKYYRDMAFDQLLLRDNVVKGKNAQKQDRLKQCAQVYYSLIKSVDDEIGRVLSALKEVDEEDNTIIVFTSDHGEMMGSHGRMQKSVFYDESFLVPFIIKYPGKIKPHVEDLMMGSTDIMPTMLGLMGMGDKIPESVMGNDYSDGLLTGEYKKHEKPESALYLSGNKKGVRTYRYTYVVNENNTYELFDNVKDPYQRKKISLDDIPSEDCVFLKKALGDWLIKSCDEWADKKKCEGYVTYQ